VTDERSQDDQTIGSRLKEAVEKLRQALEDLVTVPPQPVPVPVRVPNRRPPRRR
jgi:hypothetical protein